jgi:hypothetical protein
MEKNSVDAIIDFLKEELGVDNIHPDTDIIKDLEVSGDEFFEMLADYARAFNVNVNEYLWYFHSEEESVFNVGALFFAPPNRRVQRIPVTPNMLAEFAQQKKWHLNYPEHRIPTRRMDLIINRVVGVTAVFVIFMLLVKCPG